MAEIIRVRPVQDADERTILTSMLDFHRSGVEVKLAGLTEDQAFAHPVQPTTLTPGGVVKHLTGTERFWFSIDFAALDVQWPWTDDDPHGGFAIDAGDTVDGLLTSYRAECARSREVVAAASLDDHARGDGMEFTLRYALVHMIQETARHLGHLDLLRESTDGQVGQ